MSRHIAQTYEAADDRRVEARPRCSSCNGIIAGLADQDLGIGLNIELGLVSDECALVCDECTAKLIDARATVSGARRR